MLQRSLLLIATALAIGIVLLCKGSLTDQAPPADALKPTKEEPEPEPKKFALVQGEDTEFERAPSAPPMAEASAPKVQSPDSQRSGALVVVLIDGSEPIGKGTVVLKPAHESREVKASADPIARAATFPTLAFGDWRVEEITDLPGGLLPPRGLRPGFPIAITVKETSTRLEIPLEHSVRVFGHVRDADGEPVENLVRLFGVSDEWSKSAQSKDLPVNKGYYEGDYYAGACQIELIGFAMNHVSELETRPDPKLLLLPEGSSTEVDFALKRIAGRIEGRVIDTEGLPMEKLRLYLYRHVPLQDPATGRERDARPCVSSANTDDDGWFSFEHLAPGRFVIGASEGNFQPLAKPGASRLGAMYPGKEVELGDSLFARTEISVVRSHPCRVHGSVVVDREWRRRQASPYSVPDVMLLTHEPRPDGKDTERDVRAWNGEFDFFLDVSAPEPRLRMRAGETSIFVPLALVPDGELPLVLRFPK